MKHAGGLAEAAAVGASSLAGGFALTKRKRSILLRTDGAPYSLSIPCRLQSGGVNTCARRGLGALLKEG